MSHDQKPPRVRVVKNAAVPDARRRHDRGSAAVAVLDGDATPVPTEPTPRAAGTMLLGAVFMMAAGAGGILVALLTPS